MKGAYANRVDVGRQALPLSPSDFERQYAAALRECAAGVLTWTAPHERTGALVRFEFVLGCGEQLRGSIRCQRIRGHEGACSPTWDPRRTR